MAAAATVQLRERGREEEEREADELQEEDEEEGRQRRLSSSSSSSSPSTSSTPPLAQQQQQRRRWQGRPSGVSKARDDDALAMLAGVDVSGSRLLRRAAPRRAALFAAGAHGGQLRRSGEPYVTHCVETAKIVEAILADFYQDGGGSSSSSEKDGDASAASAAAAAAADAAAEAAVVAALLHDVPDDTPVPVFTLAAEFGDSVGGLVSAVSRLSRTYQLLRRRDSGAAAAAAVEKQRQKEQAPTLSATAVASPPGGGKEEAAEEDESEERERAAAAMSRAMVVASVDEPLCLVIKLADRLHNMRTAWALPAAKREAVAAETLRTWCPLAGRLGLFAPQAELEDLCFAVADPEGYAAVRATLDAAGTELAPAPAVAAAGGGSGPRGPRGRALLCGGGRSESFGGGRGGGVLTLSPAASPSTSTSAAATALAPPPPPPALLEDAFPPPPLPPLSLPAAPAAAQALGEDAARCASLLLTVPPFDVTTFERPPGRGAGARRRAAAAATAAAVAALSSSGSSSSSSSLPLPPGAAPRPLGDLWAAAGLLLREVALESQATGLDVRVQGRLKSALSVSRKAKRKGQRPQDVLDARALRVVVTPPKEEEEGAGRSRGEGGGRRRNDGISPATPLATAAAAKPSPPPSPSSPGEAAAVAACYRILPTVHRLWRPISGEADDYIVAPKPSGYRSLHTAVWLGGGRGRRPGSSPSGSGSPRADAPSSSPPPAFSSSPAAAARRSSSRDAGAPMEVQLRTGAMHAAAEHGAAAHWAYKEAPPTRPSSGAATDSPPPNATASDAAAAALAADAKVAATGAARLAASSSPLSSPPSSPSLDAVALVAPRLCRGDPLARVSGGKLQLGAVLRCSDDDGGEGESGSGGSSSLPRPRPRRSALVAVRVAPRLDPSAGPPPRAAVAALLEAAERGRWDAPGRGDLGTKVEEFAPGGDGRWHRVDAYGRMLPAVVMPLVAEEEEEEEKGGQENASSSSLGSAAVAAPSLQRQNAASSSPAAAAAATNASSSLSAAGDKIRLLRAMLQWTKDVEGGGGGGGSGSGGSGAAAQAAGCAAVSGTSSSPPPPSLSAAAPEDVLVLVWPPGDIARVPRGTTAGSLVASRRPQAVAAEEEKEEQERRRNELTIPHEQATTRAPPATATLPLPSSPASSSFPPVVNVNNRLVSPGTPLADGDFVVLDGGLLENL